MSRQTRLDERILKPLRISKGRKFRRDDDDRYLFGLDPWLLDETKILQSKALRRLPEKTQVHSLPFNPHIRNRMIHTLEVTAISVETASILGLNVNFCRAAALGHDVGHVPYGHAGEEVLEINHALNGVVILQEVERKGAGLNLTWEVVNAIMSHSRSRFKDKKELSIDKRQPNEASLLVLADKIAYLFSDFNDFQRLGMLKNKEVPEEFFEFGAGPNAQRKRVASCLEALIEESLDKGRISFSESEIAKKFRGIRDWMYEEMYFKKEWENSKMEDLKMIVEYFRENDDLCGNLDPNFVVSLMTDREADYLAEILRDRKPSQGEISRLSLMEIIPSLNGKEIDHTKYDFW